MQISSNKRREEVVTTIRSCLIARKEEVTLQMLEQDYEELEDEKIPFREFNCPSLLSFLQQLHNALWIDTQNGRTIIHPVETEKSSHVSALVRNQKTPRNKRKNNTRKIQKPYLGFQGSRTRVSIDSGLMINLLKHINKNLNGLSIYSAIDYVNTFSGSVQITRSELESQLKQISHEVLIWGDTLYPTNRMPTSIQKNSNNNSQRLKPSTPAAKRDYSRDLNNQSKSGPEHRSNDKPMQKLNEERSYLKAPAAKNSKDENAFIFRPAGYMTFGEDRETPVIKKRISQPKNNTQGVKNGYHNQQNHSLNQVNVPFQNSEAPTNLCKDRQNSSPNRESPSHKVQGSPRNEEDFSNYIEDSETHEELSANCDKECEDDDYEDEDSFEDDNEDLSSLIKMSTKIRLTKLIQQYPYGIWCAELPKKYLYEYKTPLPYEEFDTVRHFASYLPKIVHCIKPANAGDYKLYSADKPPPNLRNEERPANKTVDSLNEIYMVEAFSEELDKKILLPEGAMRIEEFIRPISVTELGGQEGYEEVEIFEVISPSFFWVQLRKNFMKFRKFLDVLDAFYEKKQLKYKIPLIFLETGLSVACIHSDKWQRGIIKSVSPDGRAVVHFYDSGFEKSYALDEIFFLDRMFSYLPAQAIPCGLFNVKPFQTSKWSKGVIWEFISKTSIPLIATIGSIDLEQNTMLVSLTDTRQGEDFHINDWMYEEKFGEQGQVTVGKLNFPFLHYKECLERKGYDPSAIHNIPPAYVKSNGFAEDLETEAVKFNAIESKPAEIESTTSKSEASKPGFLRFKRTKALLAKYQAENWQSSKPSKEISSSKRNQILESPKDSSENSISSDESGSSRSFIRDEILKAFLMKKNLDSKNRLKISQNQALGNENSVKKRDTSVVTNNLSTDYIFSRPPLLLKEVKSSAEEKNEDSFFGSIKSECGGNGRMEPVNWTQIRSALKSKTSKSTEVNNVDLKAGPPLQKIPNNDIPLPNSSILNVVENGLNSTFYEKNVSWVPGDNCSSGIKSKSPLLNLKQKLHTNSYKQCDFLISSKALRVLKGEMQDLKNNEEDEPTEFIKINQMIQKQEVIYEAKEDFNKTEVDQSKQKEKPPPRILRLLELQNLRKQKLQNNETV